MNERKNPGKVTRRRSVEEILAGVTCGPTEAMRVLRCRYADVTDLIETKKIYSFQLGKRTAVSVESLKAYAAGRPQPDA